VTAANAIDLDSGEDIEMEPIVQGHRRRRSSLLNGSTTRAGRSRAQGSRSQSRDPNSGNIPEENNDPLDLDSEDSAFDSLSDEDLHDDEETGLTKKERSKRNLKKKRNTRLDQRVVRETITEEERKEADQNVMRRSLVNLTLIGLWYLFSLSISLVSRPPF
jgi:solute carrier family 35, member C2